jgi:beta-mannosidase
VPATVPGCVHTDLLAAGLIPDPFQDTNENDLTWIGRRDWVYETTFTVEHPEAPRIDLACAGLDTVATLTLNGVELGHTQNMHRAYRFDVRDALRPGANTLTVAFESAYAYAERVEAELGHRPGAYAEPYPTIRKMACNFGWDWGPTVVTAGIWQPIALESWSGGRLAEVVPHVRVDGDTGLVHVQLQVERTTAELHVAVSVGEVQTATPIADDSASVELRVDGVRRWWPRGYGEQPLYPLRVELKAADGTVLDVWERRIGFRSVRVDTTPDEHGTPFTLVVNDTPIVVRGFNWIPDDAFVTRVTRGRLAARLGQAADANANYLRVWGGGRYESHDFYDLADELGLLVGQDFLFACAAYPEEDPIGTEVAAEARYQVGRLASHPSLVLWTGNNENIWGYWDWGWPEPLAGRTWGEGFYFDVLPSIVDDVDPTRPYWPGSPWSGRKDIHPNDPAHGTTHEWTVWNQVPYSHYRDKVPRFMAEFGFQAPPTYATLRRWLSDEPLTPDSPGMIHHQKAGDGNAKLQRWLETAGLPVPRDFDEWHFLTQVNQARAVSLGVQHYRSHFPVCMGTLVWQLNDNWPVTSWSAVDGAGRRKPLWYELRRVFADRLLTIQPRGDGLALIALNDTASAWTGSVSLADGSSVPIDVPPRSSASVPLAGGGLLRATLDDAVAWWFPDALPPAVFDTAVEPVDDGYLVHVTAGSVVRELTLFSDRLDPLSTVDSALVNLLPGEAHTFHVGTAQTLDPGALTRPPVLRCVNA